jgi:hypothetical protein
VVEAGNNVIFSIVPTQSRTCFGQPAKTLSTSIER